MLSNFNVITLFPEIFQKWINVGVLSHGIKEKLFEFSSTNLREYGNGSYKQLEDAPYGGGPGMVLMVEPLDCAIKESKKDINIFLSPSGQQLNEDLIQDLHEYESANIICGRYEGFDQRIIEMHSDYEIAIGQTVVSGGEVPAMFLIEALVRKIPGILGNSESLINESFINNKSDFPVYTRPEIYENLNVPEVLLSGDHKRIEEWKKNNLKDI